MLDAGGDARTEVRAVLSWSYRQLTAPAAELFELLGAHPGADLDAYAAAALLDTAVTDARLRLDVLTLGRDMATVTLVYKVRGRDMTGRQMQTWARLPEGWRVVAAHVSLIDT